MKPAAAVLSLKGRLLSKNRRTPAVLLWSWALFLVNFPASVAFAHGHEEYTGANVADGHCYNSSLDDATVALIQTQLRVERSSLIQTQLRVEQQAGVSKSGGGPMGRSPAEGHASSTTLQSWWNRLPFLAVFGEPLAALFLIGAVPVALYIGAKSQHGAVEVALSIGFLCAMQDSLSFGLPIASSAGLASLPGTVPGFPVIFIGIYKGTGACGSLLMWTGLLLNPMLWRHGRVMLTTTVVLQFLGALMAYVACQYAGKHGLEHGTMATTITGRDAMLIGRAVQGFGGGLQQSLIVNQYGHLVNPGDRLSYLASVGFAWTLGLGLAPIFAVLLTALAKPRAQAWAVPDHEVTLWAGTFLPLINLACLIAYPPMQRAWNSSLAKGACGRPPDSRKRFATVAFCLAGVVVRACFVALQEGVEAYLVQAVQWWGRVSTALAVTALAVAGLIATKARSSSWNHMRFGLETWLRLLVIVFFAGTLVWDPADLTSTSLLMLASMEAVLHCQAPL